MSTGFEWVDFYQKLANHILDYKNNSKELLSIIAGIFERANMRNYVKRENDDVCPFTIMGMANKGISNANRIAILKEFAKTFNIEAPVPESFDGIPVLNNMMALFYGDKGWDGGRLGYTAGADGYDADIHIKKLWDLFEAAILNADNPDKDTKQLFIEAFDFVISQPLSKWMITCGLFWIRPYCYISLDQNMKTYITNTLSMNYKFNKIPNGSEYLNICDDVKNKMKEIEGITSLPELSHDAWLKNHESANSDAIDNENVDDYSAETLGQILKEMYDSAERGKQVLNIHLFGIEYGQIITSNNIRVSEIVSKAGLNTSYVTEVSKGISIGAELQKNNAGKTNIVAKTSNGNNISYWFVGAMWDKTDMVETFINNGYWENGYDDKYIEEVNSINVGDKIAIKAVYTRKNTVAFDPYGNTVSCMSIKAIGTVTKNYNNGKHIDVKWEAINPAKEWYLFTYFKTIWKINPADGWMQQALVEFTFNNVPQDITRFRNEPFWAERFGDDSENNVKIVDEDEYSPYSKDDFLSEVYMSLEKYDDITSLLKRKKNIILQGAPGVGKSFLAKRLAYSIIGSKNKSKVEMIQFHQSYSYEDFIEGFRPVESGGFKLLPGVFKRFCETAKHDKQNDYFFIIDEINRGNLSKIMGELMFLLEHDKRGEEFEIPLTYSSDKFHVPENVYIIGMMNTADRSLAMIDYALRRRFSFVPIEPAFSNAAFIKYIKKDDEKLGERILVEMNALNVDIKNDLGAGFQIGHSYFCNYDKINEQWYESVLRYEILPLLDEYWFDNEKQHSKWVKGLVSDEKNPD